MQDFDLFMFIIMVVLFIVGMAMVSIGLNDYEEGLGYGGLAIMVVSIILGGMILITSIEEEEPDRHTKINYEELCYENGGDYIIVEDVETCVVEK